MLSNIHSNYNTICKLFEFNKEKKLSYKECKAEVISFKIKGEKKYRKIRKEYEKYNWPGAPYFYYKEWKSWPEFCGFEKIKILSWDKFLSEFRKEYNKQKINSHNYKKFRKENWPKCPYSYYKKDWKGWGYLSTGVEKKAYSCKHITFKNLIKEVKNHEISSFKQYKKCFKKYGWPSSPHSMYKKEWISFNHFFGKKEKKFLSYRDLVQEVRDAKITSMIQYNSYRKKHNKKLWHSSPYSYDEWTNNFNFFGKKKDHWSRKGISSYKDLKSLELVVKEIKHNKIKTRKDYRKNCKKFGWPANPDDAYADSWKGWDYFFSREQKIELSWNKFASQVRSEKIKGFWDYRNRYKNYKGWPSRPENKYPENWTNWMDLLGKQFSKKNSEQMHRNKISWEELKNQVKEAKVKDSQDYRKKYKKYGWTSSPQKSYPENWTNWDDFLQRRKLTFAQLKQEVKNNKIKGQVEYRKRSKEFEGWPSAPENFFKKEWKDWFDFLGKPRDKYHPA